MEHGNWWRLFDDYIENFGALYGKLPKQLIHRDPNPSNILFEGDEVSGFIDFDLSELTSVVGCLLLCNRNIVRKQRWGIWKMARNTCRNSKGLWPWSQADLEEKQAVFYVICSIQMICIAFFESNNIYKELAKTNRQMFKFIIQNKKR